MARIISPPTLSMEFSDVQSDYDNSEMNFGSPGRIRTCNQAVAGGIIANSCGEVKAKVKYG